MYESLHERHEVGFLIQDAGYFIVVFIMMEIGNEVGHGATFNAHKLRNYIRENGNSIIGTSSRNVTGQ